MQEKVNNAGNVEVLKETRTKEIVGDKFVNALKVETKGKERTIPLSGIFVEIGLVPNSEFISIVDKNEKGEIIVDYSCKTSDPDIYAAGDVTVQPEKQIIIAAGEGAKALLGIFRCLSMKK
jgi:alkyl hydroperoxide reductase subunit F